MGDPGLQDVDDVRVPGQSPHRLLLTQKTRAIHGVRIRAQNFHGNQPVEGGLPAPVHDAETTTASDARILETLGRQLRDNVRIDLVLGVLGGIVRHGWPLSAP
nr:hypothetical protein GCM10017611_04130 [Rhodococcus wratislaviensis]